jgi:hypothetical protein
LYSPLLKGNDVIRDQNMHRVQMFHVTTAPAAESSLFCRQNLQLPSDRVTLKRRIKHNRILQYCFDHSSELRINSMTFGHSKTCSALVKAAVAQ